MSQATHNLMTVKETAEYLRIPLPTVSISRPAWSAPSHPDWRAVAGEEGRPRSGRPAREEQGQPTVLVVDDDDALQSMFKLFLKKANFSRLIVGSGKEALAALEKQKFDFCFLDLQLPDITGDVIYQRAKEIDPGLPIVIITATRTARCSTIFSSSARLTVLKKPLQVEQLNQTLRIPRSQVVREGGLRPAVSHGVTRVLARLRR